ncbi:MULTISPECIES: GNAT family protein [Kitasatospora]|uniref:Putative acetyltransferase n=1 Tax=Kitasatospora setae (strain ATCC 33774 / DSM 43861 / JCM 3304 / KCC A-0304 / NBRC 14216 / KM-6054) TaxID=452652 RepID=E4N4G1_KITSK|nr:MULTISPECIES: GNAT family protein [Kitasatospora]BAJ26092.1 putative acetyltransferase [Kitasatospora setae KM-6054]
MPTPHWPLPDLTARTGRLELRLPTEPELHALADLAAAGVVVPGTRPFRSEWAYAAPAERARAVLRAHWRALAQWSPEDWNLPLAVFADGRPVGVQSVRAKEFALRREILSGSWLALPHQGRGLGTEARAAMLHLVFAGLGATDATSHSFADNAPSIAVSRRLGYRPDGIERDTRHGEPATTLRFRLTREQWDATARTETRLTGVDACAELFGN